MEPVNQSYNDILTELRITKVQMAKDLSISRQTMDNLSNNSFMPSLKIIYKTLDAYPWISPAWLLTNKGDMRISDDKKDNELMALKIEMLEKTISELTRTVEAQELTIELLNEYRKNK